MSLESLAASAFVVILFVIACEAIDDWRARRRWWKRHQNRKRD